MTQLVLRTCARVFEFSSPKREFSASVEHFREVANELLSELDTRLSELTFGLACIIISYQVLVLHDESTPFLASAMQILKLSITSWASWFFVVGVLQLLGFFVGFRAQRAVRFRAVMSGIAAISWLFVIAAILTTIPFVFASCLRYVLGFSINGIMYLSLSARERSNGVRSVEQCDGNRTNS